MGQVNKVPRSELGTKVQEQKEKEKEMEMKTTRVVLPAAFLFATLAAAGLNRGGTEKTAVAPGNAKGPVCTTCHANLTGAFRPAENGSKRI